LSTNTPEAVAGSIRTELQGATTGVKRLKVRSLLRRFGYAKRSDLNTAAITTALDSCGIAINPAIVRLGDHWDLDVEDWVYLSTSAAGPTEQIMAPSLVKTPVDYAADPWFQHAAQLELRSEREVETKFILPLLERLGYSEADRFDGMVVQSAEGSKQVRYTLDCALFAKDVEALTGQTLLIVEAKRDHLLNTPRHLESARSQAKSYALWTRCDFYLVTDGQTIHLHDLKHYGVNDRPLFTCQRSELAGCFGQLHARASKPALVEHYLRKQRTTEEVSEQGAT
jgi:Type I restriction enzyme R protein N terminus (HSDR_N)